jgi:hypothetical protein
VVAGFKDALAAELAGIGSDAEAVVAYLLRSW